MNHISTETQSTLIEPGKAHMAMDGGHSSKVEIVAKGVATAVAATTIIQTGKGVVTTVARHPLVMFSLGIAAGYLAHKYRKEIISISSKTAEQSRDFVLRQKENLRDLLAEAQEVTEEEETSK
jgi:sulfate adenylyltransferase subunit 1 (EFTu-like GTPase family)